MNQSPDLKNSICGAPLSQEDMPVAPAVGPGQVAAELASGTECCCGRPLLTEDQILLLVQQASLTPKTLRTLEPH
eukprot:1964676-Pyramimonas_sp.AAC.1